MQQQSLAVRWSARTVRSGPFHRALSEAVDRRGLSLSRLRAHLAAHGVSVAESTLSYWQRGLRSPSAPRSLDVVRALESVLNLPPDSLVVLIGPHRTADADRRPSLPELQQSWAETFALRDELSGTPGVEENADLDVATVVDVLTLGPQGRTAEISSTMVVRARRSGPDSFLVTHQDEEGSDVTATEIIAVDGCRVGRVRRSTRSAGMVFELLFDRGLAEGRRTRSGSRCVPPPRSGRGISIGSYAPACRLTCCGCASTRPRCPRAACGPSGRGKTWNCWSASRCSAGRGTRSAPISRNSA